MPKPALEVDKPSDHLHDLQTIFRRLLTHGIVALNRDVININL
jgi:hypothetical protein